MTAGPVSEHTLSVKRRGTAIKDWRVGLPSQLLVVRGESGGRAVASW